MRCVARPRPRLPAPPSRFTSVCFRLFSLVGDDAPRRGTPASPAPGVMSGARGHFTMPLRRYTPGRPSAGTRARRRARPFWPVHCRRPPRDPARPSPDARASRGRCRAPTKGERGTFVIESRAADPSIPRRPSLSCRRLIFVSVAVPSDSRVASLPPNQTSACDRATSRRDHIRGVVCEEENRPRVVSFIGDAVSFVLRSSRIGTHVLAGGVSV